MVKKQTIDGRNFLMTSLWTDLSDVEHAKRFCFQMNDFHLIQNISIEKWHEKFLVLRDEIFKNDPDVVITHQLPSFKSIPPRYQNGPYSSLNIFYASDLDDRIMKMKKCKLWIHGHTHEDQDYMIGNVRIVCNPAGYPGERAKSPRWEVVEI